MRGGWDTGEIGSDQEDSSLSRKRQDVSMEIAYNVLAIVLLILAVGIGWVLTLLAMPGNWLMVGAAALFAWLGPQTGVLQIHWQTVIALAELAVMGEILEFLAGVVGARRAGGSKRSAIYSLVGSLIGAIGGATAGIPIPVVGSAVGAVVGGAVGAFGGAAYAEYSLGLGTDQSVKVGKAAFWGRLVGTGAKTLVGSIMALVVVIAVCA
jgi:uncharacterized protein YqgC (DUF456 family)